MGGYFVYQYQAKTKKYQIVKMYRESDSLCTSPVVHSALFLPACMNRCEEDRLFPPPVFAIISLNAPHDSQRAY